MKRTLIAVAVLFAVLTVALIVACIWTAGTQHGGFTLSDKLGATSGVAFIVGGLLAVAATEAK